VPSKSAATSPTQRDGHIATIQADGLSQWRWESGYYAQSGVENVFSRYKAIFGGPCTTTTTWPTFGLPRDTSLVFQLQACQASP
jgi:hypothetical protein